jgi:predicted SprT family Zn-dependent metalloprotease
MFSLPIMEDNDINRFADETVYHEVAHMVDHILYQGWGHGASFFHTLHNILERSKSYGRCHSFKVRNSKRYNYRCPDCQTVVNVSSIIYGKIQRGQRRFHTGCHSTLQYIGEMIEK